MRTSMPILMRRSSAGQGAIKTPTDHDESRLSRKTAAGLLSNKRLTLKEVEMSLVGKEGRLISSGVIINDPQFK